MLDFVLLFILFFFTSLYLSKYIKYKMEASSWYYWKIAFYRGTFFEEGARPDTFCITNGNKYLDLGMGYLSLHSIPQDAVKINRVKWVDYDDVRVTVLHDKETAQKVLVALHKYYKTGGGI